MRLRIALIACLAIATAGCASQLKITEGQLSNGTRVASIEAPGDGITPSTSTLVIVEHRGGATPLNVTSGEGVFPSALKGAVAGAFMGGGMAAQGALLRPATTAIDNGTTVSMRSSTKVKASPVALSSSNAAANPVSISSASARSTGVGIGIGGGATSSSGVLPNPPPPQQ